MAAQPSHTSGADIRDGSPAAEAAEAVHGHEVPAGTTEVAAHGGEGGGLPQFKFEYWGGQIVWLVLIFVVLYLAISRIFVPRLRRALDDRARTISESIEEARLVQAEAAAQTAAAEAEIEEARARARRTAAEAKAKVAAEIAARQAEEDARLQVKTDEAEARIRKTRDKAMKNVRQIASDTTQALVEKLTGEPADAAAVEAALDRAAGAA
jgi:F-type H+-transporting ATPase subunit b